MVNGEKYSDGFLQNLHPGGFREVQSDTPDKHQEYCVIHLFIFDLWTVCQMFRSSCLMA